MTVQKILENTWNHINRSLDEYKHGYTAWNLMILFNIRKKLLKVFKFNVACQCQGGTSQISKRMRSYSSSSKNVS